MPEENTNTGADECLAALNNILAELQKITAVLGVK